MAFALDRLGAKAIRKDTAFQACVMAVVLLSFGTLQVHLKPLRSEIANITDGTTCAGLVFLFASVWCLRCTR